MRISTKGLLAIFFVFQILLIKILTYFPEIVDRFYSNGIYSFISKGMRYAFGWLPFSVGDLFYTLAGIYILRWLFLNRKRIYKDTLNWGLDIIATLSLVYFAFHLLWAYNYYRLPLNEGLNIKADYTTEALIATTKRFIERSNTIHAKLADHDSAKIEMPFTKAEVFVKLQNGYDQLAMDYPNFKYSPKSIKKSLYSVPLTYMGFSGYLNPFTLEAQVDGLIPTYKFPTTACHEIAHQIGYAAENEANFIGCLATIYNDDLYFKYSGYTFGLRYCLAEIFRRDESKYYELLETIRPGILKNYQEVRDFWNSYANPLEPIFEKTYDTFLKSNNQSGGMKSYSYVVALLVNFYDSKEL